MFYRTFIKKGTKLQNKIKNLIYRIENNYSVLEDENILDLVKPTLETLKLLLYVNATDNKIRIYLKNVKSSINLIEEKLDIIENK